MYDLDVPMSNRESFSLASMLHILCQNILTFFSVQNYFVLLCVVPVTLQFIRLTLCEGFKLLQFVACSIYLCK